MLGGGDAKFSGSIELEKKISIPANGGVQVKNSIGLSSGVNAGDDAATAAQGLATTFITGNYSWNHGGGIMSNGDLYLGQPADTYVYPSLKLKATKVLDGRGSKMGSSPLRSTVRTRMILSQMGYSIVTLVPRLELQIMMKAATLRLTLVNSSQRAVRLTKSHTTWSKMPARTPTSHTTLLCMRLW